MTPGDQSTASVELDETISQMEKLYRAMTGRDFPPNDKLYAPIPAEKDPIEHVDQQLGRLLNMLGQTSLRPEAVSRWEPPISVWESPTELTICMDVPGVRRSDLEITSQGNVITVFGWRPATKNNQFHLIHNECAMGHFRRTLTLPGHVHAGQPTAQLQEGILQIRVPKEKENHVSQIKPVPVE